MKVRENRACFEEVPKKTNITYRFILQTQHYWIGPQGILFTVTRVAYHPSTFLSDLFVSFRDQMSRWQAGGRCPTEDQTGRSSALPEPTWSGSTESTAGQQEQEGVKESQGTSAIASRWHSGVKQQANEVQTEQMEFTVLIFWLFLADCRFFQVALATIVIFWQDRMSFTLIA